MWQFFNDHPVVAILAMAFTAALATVLVILIARLGRNGIKAKLGNNEISFGKSNTPKETTETETMRDLLILSSSVNHWQKQVDKQISALTQEVVSTSIRFANLKIDNAINGIKNNYRFYLKEDKDHLTVEDNYQMIICGFVLDQIREDFKDIICAAIREDHFDTKTQNEIEAISETAITRAQLRFEEQIEVLNKDVIKKIEEENLSKVKKETAEVIEITAKKYRESREAATKLIEENEVQQRESLKLKFPNLSAESIDNIVKYY